MHAASQRARHGSSQPPAVCVGRIPRRAGGGRQAIGPTVGGALTSTRKNVMWGAVPAAAASTSASSSTSTKTSMGARLLKPQHDWLRIFLSSSALSFESTHSRFVLWLSTRSSLTIKCRTKARLSAAQLSPPRRATYPTSRCEPAGARHRRSSAPAGAGTAGRGTRRGGRRASRSLESRRARWVEDPTGAWPNPRHYSASEANLSTCQRINGNALRWRARSLHTGTRLLPPLRGIPHRLAAAAPRVRV